MLYFNRVPFREKSIKYMQECIKENKICGDGKYTKLCHSLMEEKFNANKVLLTTSGTSALEMSSLLCGTKPGDEIIMPSFTFCSTADAFVLHGGVPVFVDIRPDTMNIDENLIEAAITEKTIAVCVVHYAGVSCEMDKIRDICNRHNLFLVEDAAQGVMSKYNGEYLGTISDFGCYSFHETKNYSMGEGGALIVNNPSYKEKAEIFREKGTDRSRFLRGQIDKYTWVEKGGSMLPSDMLAAYLYAQLEDADEINNSRLHAWNRYNEGFQKLKEEGKVDLPYVPENCVHNAHMYYLKVRDLDERTNLISFLKENDVQAVFHYIPLHSADAGLKYCRFHGEDKYTTVESERLMRLPLFDKISDEEVDLVIKLVYEFFSK